MGAVFLLAVLVTVPMLNERIAMLSTLSGKPAQSQVATEVDQALDAAVGALGEKVDSLIAANEERVQAAIIDASQEVGYLADSFLQPLFSRYAEMDGSLDAVFTSLEDPLMMRFKEMEDKVDALHRRRTLYPVLAELNQQADSMIVAHKDLITPELLRLNAEIDELYEDLQDEPIQLVSPEDEIEIDSEVEIEIVDIDVDEPMIEPGGDSLPKTSRIPVMVRGADVKILRTIQDKLAQYHLESTIGPGGGTLMLSSYFDFVRFATELNPEQVNKLGQLADALADIIPCYSKSAHQVDTGHCPGGVRNPVGLDVVLIQSFSLGGNIGTVRINYNSRLADTRSVYILKTLVNARPDLLNYMNSAGKSVFGAIGKLAPADDKRTRRIILQFIMEEQ